MKLSTLNSQLSTAHASQTGMRALAVMGILNVTPDSFSDGGQHNTLETAIAHAKRMLDEGATILDVGGESTRPGFTPVDADEEKLRILPVIRELRTQFPDCIISVDTMKSDIAESAIAAGGNIINDVSGLADRRLLDVAKDTGATLVLMQGYATHTGLPRPVGPGQIGAWVAQELEQLLDQAISFGIPLEQLMVDPGFGFGKRHLENKEVLDALPLIKTRCPVPILVAASRKHFVCELYPEAQNDRVDASVRLAVDAAKLGGKIFRVHDVDITCTALGI